MAQGLGKLSKSANHKKKSGNSAANKKKVVRTKTVTKGRKEFKAKAANNIALLENIATTKAINRKNECTVAAKAVAVGTKFFLNDITSDGKSTHQKLIQQRNKKQMKSTSNNSSTTNQSSTNRIKEQLRKLGRDVV